MRYFIKFKRRGFNEGQTSYIVGEDLTDALIKFHDKCEEEDITGIFFELENADVDILKEDPMFHTISVSHGEYGIMLEEVKEM